MGKGHLEGAQEAPNLPLAEALTGNGLEWAEGPKSAQKTIKIIRGPTNVRKSIVSDIFRAFKYPVYINKKVPNLAV